MDITREFRAAAGSDAGPAGPPAARRRPPADTSYFATRVRDIATSLGDARFLCDDASGGGWGAAPAALDGGGGGATAREEAETVVALLQRVGAELAALGQVSDAFARSELGRRQPYRAAHQQGLVAVLCARLQALVRRAAQLRAQTARARPLVAAAAAATAAAAPRGVVPPDLALPPLRINLEGIDGPGGGGGGAAAAAAPAAGLPAGLRQRRAAAAAAAAPALTQAPPPSQPASQPLHQPSPPPPPPPQQQQQELATVAAGQQELDARQVEAQMGEISQMLALLSEKLGEQQADVESILADAVQARSHVAEGNKQLAEANERPSRLRDVVVFVLLLLTALLWWLDWYAS
jgi:hypothetical protein